MFIVEKMVKYNTQQRIFIVREFYSSNKCVILVQRSYRREFKFIDSPSRQEIMDLIEKFEQTGSLADAERSGRPSIMTEKITDSSWRQPLHSRLN
jgi:hypothetical protein